MSGAQYLLKINILFRIRTYLSHLSSITFIVLLSNTILLPGQILTIASYNVENLMDTLDNLHANDNDFLPQGKNGWTSRRYKTKLQHLAEVISGLGDEDGPEILGLVEIENKQVLEDLVVQKAIRKSNYQIIHKDSKDERGIDVALLYKQDKFKILSWTTMSAALEKIPTHTRDILQVKGIFAKDTIVVMVNHWPSRRMGKEQSEHKRITMALLVREAIDSLAQLGLRYPVVVMGDLNDEPMDKSIHEVLISRPDWASAGKDGLMNPFENKAKAGEGSYRYEGKWNMIDHIILGTGWRNGRWELVKSGVYHPAWLHYKSDLNQGPFKTFNRGQYKAGYSDHFPVFISLKVR